MVQYKLVIYLEDNIIIKISKFSNKTESRRKGLSLVGKISPYITFVLYGIFSIVVIINFGISRLDFFAIPLITFVVVTIIRKILNRKRPFEIFDIPKLIGHENGESFPSRHSACAVTIALAIFSVNEIWGVFALAVSAVICISRVLCGVHFIKDVIAGIFFGIIFWLI